jgi:cell division protein FtsB
MKTIKIKRYSISKKRLLFLGIVTVILYFGFFAEFNFYRLWTLQQQKADLLQQVELSKSRNKELLDKIEKLKYDEAVIEEEARENMMAREGETIYWIPSQESE